MRRISRQLNFMLSIQVVEKVGFVIVLRITDERQKCEPVQDIASAGNDSPAGSGLRLRLDQVLPVHKLDGSPDGDGREWVENFLSAFVHFPDVLDRDSVVVDL
jgi:hypothetical protein